MPVGKDSFELIVRQADRELLGSPLRRQPEAPFYHYTTEAGLKGILEAEVVWATDYRYLNDPDELTRGEVVIQSELDAAIREYSETTPRGWFCRHIEVNRRTHRLVDIPNVEIFVASFSSAGDLLEQWRAYTDDAQGYALGFNSVPLPTGIQAPSDLASSLAVDFGPCLYEEQAYRARVREVLFQVADGLDKYALTYCDSPEQVDAIAHEAFGSAMARLATLVPFLKDPAYASEREWRLIFLGTPPTRRARPTRYGEAPYIEVSLKKPDRMDLNEVIAGPRAPGVDFARTTLDRCGYVQVAVARSRVPYR